MTVKCSNVPLCAFVIVLGVSALTVDFLEVSTWFRQLQMLDFVGIELLLNPVLTLLGLSRDIRIKNVTVVSRFRQVDRSSLRKDVNADALGPTSNLHYLHTWTKPAQRKQIFMLSLFSSTFLPPRGQDVGQPWWVFRAPDAWHNDGKINSALYEPPLPCGSPAKLLLHKLFGMFHPNVFLLTRAAPSGTAAVVVRRQNGTLDILFRSHVEFQLNDPPLRPFWFTPSQFSGRVVIKEDGSALHHFSAQVPNGRSLNVDLEWLTGEHKGDSEVMEVDIGYIPEMALESVNTDDESGVAWAHGRDTVDAQRALDRAFFPFLKVPYHNLSEVATLAAAESKLVHSIILWGALDDQSC